MVNKMIIDAISTLLAMGLANTAAAEDKTQNTSQNSAQTQAEKCYGIAKAGMNDCGTASHGCAGEAASDGSKEEWISLPTGVCNKIVGSSLKPLSKKAGGL